MKLKAGSSSGNEPPCQSPPDKVLRDLAEAKRRIKPRASRRFENGNLEPMHNR
jgi:hypothetical protein